MNTTFSKSLDTNSMYKPDCIVFLKINFLQDYNETFESMSGAILEILGMIGK